ncbi:MFS transporter [Demequina soli]|uniref:MFS transporter n=1 Tax=Demequina soli TaxID=1638987 RepID=UPI0007802B64|nr:MFS transporter [Demequina soli]
MSSFDVHAYRRVLAYPQAVRAFATSSIGRIAYTFVYLPLFYVTHAAAGSIAVAGAALGLYGAGAGMLAPGRAALIDRFGPRPMLTAMSALFGSVLACLALASLLGAPAAGVVVLAGLAGAVAPPLGPTMRVAWATLVPEHEDLKTALSLDATVEEVFYLASPAIAGALLWKLEPGAVLLVPAALIVIGGVVFARSGAVAPMGSEQSREAGRGRSPLRARGFVPLLVFPLVAGGLAGFVTIYVPAATALSGPAVAGLVLAVFAVGSALGGLAYGTMRVKGGPPAHLGVLAVGLAGATACLAFAGSPASVAGMLLSPAMVVAYLLAPRIAPPDRQNSATTWVNTSYNIGSAAVTAAAGALIAHLGAQASALLVGLSALVVVVVAWWLASGRPSPSQSVSEVHEQQTSAVEAGR